MKPSVPSLWIRLILKRNSGEELWNLQAPSILLSWVAILTLQENTETIVPG